MGFSAEAFLLSESQIINILVFLVYFDADDQKLENSQGVRAQGASRIKNFVVFKIVFW
jgi:hypothetical protein